MKKIIIIFCIVFSLGGTQAFAENKFGLNLGVGTTADIPDSRAPTTKFILLSPNYQYELTKYIVWQPELNFGLTIDSNKILVGVSPLTFKFHYPIGENIDPYILLGSGISYTDWQDILPGQLGGDFQFILSAEVGVEKGDWTLGYRLFHLSNAGTKTPNSGFNAHMITLGYKF